MAKKPQQIAPQIIDEAGREIVVAGSSEVEPCPKVAGYDYRALPMDIAKTARSIASDIRRRVHDTTRNIIEIGQQLIEVRDALPHGQWLPWLEAEFTWTSRTATNFIHAAEAFGGDKLEIISDLKLPPTVVIYLATAPEEALNAVVERAQAGEKLTVAAVQRAIREARQAVPEPLPTDPWERPIDLDAIIGDTPVVTDLASASEGGGVQEALRERFAPPSFNFSFVADFELAMKDHWLRGIARLHDDIRVLALQVIERVTWCKDNNRPLPKIWRQTMPANVTALLDRARALAGGDEEGVTALLAGGHLAVVFEVLADLRHMCAEGNIQDSPDMVAAMAIRSRLLALDL